MKKIIKKCIIKYLLKYFNGSPKNYYYVRDHTRFYLFLRWLAELVKNEEDTIHVMILIASYMHYNNLDLPFTDIFVVGNTVCVCTRKPSLWIGKADCIIGYSETVGGVNSSSAMGYGLGFRLVFAK